MTGRLVDMAFTLGGKQRVTLEINGDFREIWDKLHQEQVLDVEIKKHRKSAACRQMRISTFCATRFLQKPARARML